MNQLPNQAELAFKSLFEMPCRAISISRYGAIQLGFGEAMDHLIAGKWARKRYDMEVGTYTSVWNCIRRDGTSDAREALPAILIGAKIVSIRAEKGRVVLEINDGRTIPVEGSDSSGNIFYVHFRDVLGVFYDSKSGWSLGE